MHLFDMAAMPLQEIGFVSVFWYVLTSSLYQWNLSPQANISQVGFAEEHTDEVAITYAQQVLFTEGENEF